MSLFLQPATALNRYAKPAAAGVIPQAPQLRASFPNVQELRIELQFEEQLQWAPSTQVHVLHPPARLSLRYACPFPGCTGHFDLGEPVTRLLAEADKSFASDMRCTGMRPQKGSPNTNCAGHMSFRVTASYTRRQR
jgi:hypothetical protein